MTPEELSVANLFLIDFEKSGIHLNESSRKKFVNLNDEINQLGREFLSDTGSLEASIQVDRSELRGCDGWWNGTQQVQFIPTTPYYSSLLLRTAHDANLRKKMYTASNKPTEKQVQVLEEMLIKRAELANLLGKRSFADLFLEDKMAQTPENVSTFLSSLVKRNLPKVSGEMQLLQKLKQLNEKDPNIMGWDQQYYIYLFEAQLRQSHRQIYKKLSQYFSVGTVIKGLSNILETMYQLRFRLVDSVNYSELWDPSVRKIEVLDNNDEIVGIIYFDLFGRPNKPGIAAHYTLQCSRRVDDDDNNGISFDSKGLENPVMGPVHTSSSGKAYQIPVVVLSCCFNHPINGTPTLLSMNEVETLFHEMGHAIHSMVARTDYHNVAGTRCKIDFVELPSIFMETLGTSSTIIPFYAKHHATLDPIPEALIQDYKKLSNQFNILETQHQILLSSIDQAYHSIDLSNPPARNFSYDIIEQKQNSWGTYPYVKGTHLGIKFGHLFSYSATYYSYLLGRCFANKIWEKGFKGHDLRGDIGEVFRNEVLAPGGSRDPWLSISNCLYKFELVSSDGKGVSKENEVLLDKLSRGDGKSMEIVGEWGLGSTRTFH
jgi:intermediate peptidase